jgi:hypothetical protein
LSSQQSHRLHHHLLEGSVLPLDERLHVRCPGIMQRLLFLQKGRPILERDLLQPCRLRLGKLLDLPDGVVGRIPDRISETRGVWSCIATSQAGDGMGK